LPNALENLSNALQSVQELFRLNKNNTSTASDDDPENTIAFQLNNLSSTILSSVAKSNMSSLTENNSSLKKSSPSSQQQRLKAPTNAPVYNPTPILVLKKFQPTPETTEKSGFKRKTETEDNNQNQDHADVDKTEIDESLQKKKKVEPTVQDTVLSPPPKIDMISFGKLKPSQQLLKRYEMLNKPIKLPSSSTLTASALSVARSKQLSDNMAKDKSVPHLIMDSSSLSGSKVPIAMRQRYLKFIFDNGKSACSSVEKACEKADEQEKSVYHRTKNKAIYMIL
jgi:hypothetical protein